MKRIPVILLVLLLVSFVSSAQFFSLNISYNSAEKSKDSHSTTETISISGTSVAYSVKYTGRRGGNMNDEAKACVFTSVQISKIKETLADRELNVNDSLINISTGMNSVAISISTTSGRKETKIKIKGDPGELNEQPLYKNSMYLILSVKKMLEECK